jgi:hypothetical protein
MNEYDQIDEALNKCGWLGLNDALRLLEAMKGNFKGPAKRTLKQIINRIDWYKVELKNTKTPRHGIKKDDKREERQGLLF